MRDGWIKRQKSFTDVESIRVRDEDKARWIYRARARQTISFFTDRGIAYTIRVNEIPLTTGHGEPIQRHFGLEDNEHVVGVVCHDPRCLPEVTAAARARHGPVQETPGQRPAAWQWRWQRARGAAAASVRRGVDRGRQGLAVCARRGGAGVES